MARKKKRSKQPSQVPPLDVRHYFAMELMIQAPYDPKVGRKRWLSRGEIADEVGISRMQLHRWEQRKDFQHEKGKRLRAHIKATTPRRKSYKELIFAGDAEAFATVMNAYQG